MVRLDVESTIRFCPFPIPDFPFTVHCSLFTTIMIYLNGEFLSIEQARISVLDRGFIFGDGVYEVIPVYSRHPFRLDEHLRRLQASLNSIRLVNPHDDQTWMRLIRRLVELNDPEDQSLYMHITRGPAKRDHAFPKVITPTVFLMSNPLTTPPQHQVRDGVCAIQGNVPGRRAGCAAAWSACEIGRPTKRRLPRGS